MSNNNAFVTQIICKFAITFSHRFWNLDTFKLKLGIPSQNTCLHATPLKHNILWWTQLHAHCTHKSSFATITSKLNIDAWHIICKLTEHHLLKPWESYVISFCCIHSVHEFADVRVYGGENAPNIFAVLYVSLMTKTLTICERLF